MRTTHLKAHAGQPRPVDIRSLPSRLAQVLTRWKSRIISIAVSRIILASVCVAGLSAAPVDAAPAHPATAYVEGEAIITFKKSTDLPTAKIVLGGHGLGWAKHFDWLSRRRQQHTGLVRAENRTTAALIDELKQDSRVETAEPNYLRWISAAPNDTLFPQLWGLQNTGQVVNGTTSTAGDDIEFVGAWDLVQSPTTTTVVVAVIDTGVDYTHPDLVSNMWHNAGETAGDGLDNDGNGYTDDYFGYDFADDVADPADSSDHGTHVAGTIAATGNNGLGVIGVNYRAKIMALKASGNGDAFTDAAVIEAIQYATMMKKRGVNIVAINASFGGGGSSTTERAAIQEAGDAGIVFCTAAGNDSVNNDTTPTYPASYRLPNMIVAAASDQNDALASFSNYGVTTVDLTAPGVNILSTKPLSVAGTTASVHQASTAYLANGLTYAGITTGITAAVYYCNLGYTADFPSAVRGNIALILRGTLTFSNKVANAMAAGAQAAIIYNNVPGNFSGTLIGPSSWIPAVSLSQADGHALLAALPTTATVINNYDPTQLYQFMEGTSMAAPHVAGAVAFAAMNYPDETVTQRIERILGNVDTVSVLSGKVRTGGRLNLLRMLTVADSSPPAVSIASPASGTTYTNAQTVTITAAATDNVAVTKVEFYDAGTLEGTDTVAPYTYAWTFTGADNGTHNWTARASDAANNTATSAVAVLTVNITTSTCSYALATSAVAVGAEATAGSVGVITDAGCAWTATQNDDWLAITSGSSDTGNGTVDFSIAANLSSSPRSGTLTIAGQTFTVAQAGRSGPAITTKSSLPDGLVGRLYSQILEASGGSTPYRWSLTSGSLPDGVTLKAASGEISGTPRAETTNTFRVRVTDANLLFSEEDFVLRVIDPAVRFTPLQGRYCGLVLQTNTPSHASSGAIKFVVSKTGSFAASLSMGGLRYSFKGQFDVEGAATNTVARKDMNSLQVILHLDVSQGTDQITGTVSDGVFTSELLTDRAVFGTTNPCPWNGQYTFVLVPADENDPSVPQGYGYGSVTVTTKGAGKVAGVLGDGTKFKASVPVSKYDTCPLYSVLYENQGSCIGWVSFGTSNALAAVVDWFKPALASSAYYPAGFTTTLTLEGAEYVSPSLGGPAVAGNWQLTLSDGNLPSNIVKNATVSASGATTTTPAGDDKLTLHIVPATGAFSGHFVHPANNQMIQFKGLLLQQPYDIGGGCFLGTNASGQVELLSVP